VFTIVVKHQGQITAIITQIKKHKYWWN